MRFIDASDIHVFTRHVWAPPLAEAQRYSGDALEIRDFYVGLPHCDFSSVVNPGNSNQAPRIDSQWQLVFCFPPFASQLVYSKNGDAEGLGAT